MAKPRASPIQVAVSIAHRRKTSFIIKERDALTIKTPLSLTLVQKWKRGVDLKGISSIKRTIIDYHYYRKKNIQTSPQSANQAKISCPDNPRRVPKRQQNTSICSSRIYAGSQMARMRYVPTA